MLTSLIDDLATTGREIVLVLDDDQFISLIALGSTNQEVAQQLVVSRGTVKAHAASMYRKLDVANRTEAVARAR